MTAVAVSPTSKMRLGQPSELFPVKMLYTGGLGTIANCDVSADGQRFLIAGAVGEQRDAPITVILNWQSLLER